MRILLIDDLRNFRDGIINDPSNLWIARNSEQAIELLDSLSFDAVWWDHDLGGDDTTTVVADYLLKQAILSGDVPQIGTCYIHTSNPVGAIDLRNTLESRYLGYHCVRVSQTETDEIFISGEPNE